MTNKPMPTTAIEAVLASARRVLEEAPQLAPVLAPIIDGWQIELAGRRAGSPPGSPGRIEFDLAGLTDDDVESGVAVFDALGRTAALQLDIYGAALALLEKEKVRRGLNRPPQKRVDA